MTQAAQLFEQLSRTFGDGVECVVAKCLLGFLDQHKEATHITLQLVRQLTPGADAGDLDSAIVRTLQYLAGDAIRVLNTQFELIDGDEAPIILTEEEVGYVLSDQINPITGEIDTDIKTKVAIFFCPSEEYRRLESSSIVAQNGGAA